MICKYFTPFLLVTAVTFSQVFCDTQGSYQIQPQNPHQQRSTAEGPAPDSYYQPSLAYQVANPRLGSFFDSLTLDSLVQPAVTCIGVVVGLFGFFQITNWILDLVEVTKSFKKKNSEKKTPESKNTTELETNEVDARRKRMLSAENTEHILRTIETAEKTFEQ